MGPVIPCQVKDCNTPGICLITHAGKHFVGIYCEEHRWNLMKRIREGLASHGDLVQGAKGWQAFCEKFGYAPHDSRFKPSATPLGVDYYRGGTNGDTEEEAPTEVST